MDSLTLDDQLSYSLRRQYVDEYLARQLGSLASGARLLDLGGVKRGQRGRTSVAAYGAQVVTLNIVTGKGLDVQADAARLPFAAASFQAVLCSEVMEHVPAPLQVAAQVHRVLQPGGALLITVPFLFRQHADPADYGRYTEWYWREKLGELGFTQIEIEKQGLFASVLVDMLRHWAHDSLSSNPRLYRLRRWLLPRLVRTARRRAVRTDSQPRHQTHPVWGAYVGGFGIRAVKGGP